MNRNEFSARVKVDAFALAKGRCQKCGAKLATGNIHYDHVIPCGLDNCSFLYGAAARAAFALGFKRIGTYILASEPGTSLTAAGWRMIAETSGGSWSRSDRPRVDKHPTQPKLLFEAVPAHTSPEQSPEPALKTRERAP